MEDAKKDPCADLRHLCDDAARHLVAMKEPPSRAMISSAIARAMTSHGGVLLDLDGASWNQVAADIEWRWMASLAYTGAFSAVQQGKTVAQLASMFVKLPPVGRLSLRAPPDQPLSDVLYDALKPRHRRRHTSVAS